MTYARKTQISLKDTPYYHCVARCVRRAWLWGYDEYAGKDYSHRKNWVIERLRELVEVFAIEICAYAVLSNHYHLVVHVNTAQARQWDDDEVIRRWQAIFGVPSLIERYQGDESITRAERMVARVTAVKGDRPGVPGAFLRECNANGTWNAATGR